MCEREKREEAEEEEQGDRKNFKDTTTLTFTKKRPLNNWQVGICYETGPNKAKNGRPPIAPDLRYA